MTSSGTVNGIKDAAALYRYVFQGGNAGGGSFAEALKMAENSAKSDEEILAETLEEIYLRNRGKDSEEKQEEKKDFWELRTERQKLLDEYFERKELQRKAFEEMALKRKAANKYFFSGEGLLFLHSAAEEIFGGLA